MVVYVVIVIHSDKSKYILGVFRSVEFAKKFIDYCRSKESKDSNINYQLIDFPLIG